MTNTIAATGIFLTIPQDRPCFFFGICSQSVVTGKPEKISGQDYNGVSHYPLGKF
jgi:hypothetical protein